MSRFPPLRYYYSCRQTLPFELHSHSTRNYNYSSQSTEKLIIIAIVLIRVINNFVNFRLLIERDANEIHSTDERATFPLPIFCSFYFYSCSLFFLYTNILFQLYLSALPFLDEIKTVLFVGLCSFEQKRLFQAFDFILLSISFKSFYD